MNIDQELQRLIDADLEDWKARKHVAVFRMEDGDDRVTVGSLFIDGKPIRPGLMVGCHWVSMTEAQHIAEKLNVRLQIS